MSRAGRPSLLLSWLTHCACADRWKQVAEQVQTRSGDQCWKRWNDSLDPQLNHSQWTPAEDVILEEAVLRCGRLWSKIATEALPGRSGLACKNRWDHIQRKQRRMHQSQRDIVLREPDGHPFGETDLLSYSRHHSSTTHAYYADLDLDSKHRYDFVSGRTNSSEGSSESLYQEGVEKQQPGEGLNGSADEGQVDEEEEEDSDEPGRNSVATAFDQSAKPRDDRFLGPTFTTNWTIAAVGQEVDNADDVTPTREAYGLSKATPSQGLFSSSLSCSLPVLSNYSHNTSHHAGHYGSEPVYPAPAAWFPNSTQHIHSMLDRCPPLPSVQQQSGLDRPAEHRASSSTAGQMELRGIVANDVVDAKYSVAQRSQISLGKGGNDHSAAFHTSHSSSHSRSDGFRWSPLKSSASRGISVGVGSNTPFADLSSSRSSSRPGTQHGARSIVARPETCRTNKDGGASKELQESDVQVVAHSWSGSAVPERAPDYGIAFADQQQVVGSASTGHWGDALAGSAWQPGNVLASSERKSDVTGRVKTEHREAVLVNNVVTPVLRSQYPVEKHPFFQQDQAQAYSSSMSKLPQVEAWSNSCFNDDVQHSRQNSGQGYRSISKLLQNGQRLYDDGEEIEEGGYDASQTSDEEECLGEGIGGGEVEGEEDEEEKAREAVAQQQQQQHLYQHQQHEEEGEEEEEHTSRTQREVQKRGYLLQLCRQPSPAYDTSTLQNASPFWPAQHLSPDSFAHGILVQSGGQSTPEKYQRLFSG